MALTFSAFQSAVKSYGGYGAGDTDYVKLALNDAERMLYGGPTRWDFLHKSVTLTTIPGTANYALPSDFVMHERLRRSTDGIPDVRWVASDDFADNWAPAGPYVVTTLEGPPVEYTIFLGNIVFTPAPDQAYDYQHDYWHMPTLMSADGDTTLIPDEDEMVLVYGALMRMASRDKDWTAAAYWEAQWDTAIKGMKAAQAMNQFKSAERIPVPSRFGGRYRG